MAPQSLIEFHTLTLSAPPSSSQLPAELEDQLTTLGSDDSAQDVYFGQQLEHPTRWSLIVTRPTGSRPDPAWTDALEALDAHVESRSTVTAPHARGDPSAALEAPCTEVFTCHGVDDGFLDANMKPFADGVEKGRPKRFHGLTYGEFEQPGGGEQPEGTAVRMLLGWDSKEAHLAQRGEGKVIDEYIHHVKTGRKGIDLFHVNLTKV